MLATLGIIQSISRGLLLDTNTGASAAYSLRKLRNAYNGSAIRVRRASDNTEQDIGFTNLGVLDESSLTAFVGSSSGYVTKWYDQSGSSRDAVQATSANQPRIVNAGTIEKLNNKPAIFFDGNNYYFGSISKTINTDETHIYVLKTNNTSTDQRITGNPNSNAYRLRIDPAGSWNFIDYFGASTSIASVSSDTSICLIFGYTQNRKAIIYKNSLRGTDGIVLGGTSMNGTSETDIKLGSDRNATLKMIGYMQEVIMYPVDKSSNRTGIESNINSYYSIY